MPTLARQQMVHRATVTRSEHAAVGGSRDPWGGVTVDEALDEVHAALPCFAWAPTDSSEVIDTDKAAVFGAVRLAVPSGSDVTEDDVITSIVDRAGSVVFDGPLRVTAVTRRAGHVAVMARVARGGSA